MRIIGCDLHARQQVLAMLDTTTGEVVEVTVKHEGDNGPTSHTFLRWKGYECPPQYGQSTSER
jgi:hypothetical protein